MGRKKKDSEMVESQFQYIYNTSSTETQDFVDFYKKSFLQYIGSKRKLLPLIIKHINGDNFVDLMSGTHSLGYFLKDKKKVIANDIMQYSYTIGKAIVESSILNLELLDIEKNDKFNFFERHYAGTYFTVKQCKDLDAIKYSIENLTDYHLKACYYSCVFNILDRIGTTAGHFDGFLKQDTKKAKIRKNKNVINYFEDEVRNFRNKINIYGSKVFNLDAIELLDLIEKSDTIYIDPPYNHRQYNTLYHILEMFVKYEGSVKNCLYKYPKERYYSPYCYKTKALLAFDKLIKKASDKSDNVVFSYSNKGTISIRNLREIFLKYFENVKGEQISYYHRKQKTSKGTGIVKEYIFSLTN